MDEPTPKAPTEAQIREWLGICDAYFEGCAGNASVQDRAVALMRAGAAAAAAAERERDEARAELAEASERAASLERQLAEQRALLESILSGTRPKNRHRRR